MGYNGGMLIFWRLVGTTLLMAALFAASLVATPYLAVPRVSAQTVPGVIDAFGGPILGTILCTKPLGILLFLGPPTPGTFMVLIPGTIIYRYALFRPGATVVGLDLPVPIPCIVGKILMGVGLKVLQVGTSL